MKRPAAPCAALAEPGRWRPGGSGASALRRACGAGCARGSGDAGCAAGAVARGLAGAARMRSGAAAAMAGRRRSGRWLRAQARNFTVASSSTDSGNGRAQARGARCADTGCALLSLSARHAGSVVSRGSSVAARTQGAVLADDGAARAERGGGGRFYLRGRAPAGPHDLFSLGRRSAKRLCRWAPPSPAAPGRRNCANFFSRAFRELRGERLLLFLGRLHEKKGCDLLLEAFRRVAPPLHLVFAGPCADADLEARLRALAEGLPVTFTGPLYGEEKWAALAAAEVFILPSHQENFGMAVAEALACGLAGAAFPEGQYLAGNRRGRRGLRRAR